MPNTSVPVPNLVSGVSQQPPKLRLPSQVAACDDCYPSVVDGLVKRYPTGHVRTLFGAPVQPRLSGHLINRDPSERYQVVLGNELLRVFDLDGTELPVRGQLTPFTLDLSYLDRRAPNRLLDPESFNVAGGWAASDTTNTITPLVSTQGGPLAYGFYREMGTKATAVAQARYSQTAGQFPADGTTTALSVYFRQSPTNPCNHVELVLVDTTNTVNHRAIFLVVAGVPTLESVTAGSVAAVVPSPDGAYRLGLFYDAASTSPTVPGNGRRADVRVQSTGDVFLTKRGLFFGAQVSEYRSSLGVVEQDYLLDQSGLRAVTVQDFTLVANDKVVVAKDAATEAADTTTGHAFVFVREGRVESGYEVTIKQGATTTKVAVLTYRNGEGATPPARCHGGEGNTQAVCEAAGGIWITDVIPAIDAERVAELLRVRLGAISGITATRVGTVVRITSASAFDEIKVVDTQGGLLMVKVHKEVERVSDLPLICQDGFKVKVVGSGDDTQLDDFYVKFVGDAAGVFGPGKWVESVPFSSQNKLLRTTMPHQLVRKQDDAGGTVTGTPGAKYFEWGPATWVDRLVGDDLSNPFPSLLGKVVTDVFFWRGRFGFTSPDTVVMSEAARYFNLFRTTTLSLVDSDVIDIILNNTKVSKADHSVPWDERLVVFSERSVYVVGTSRNQLLTPQTISAAPKLEYENSAKARPVAMGKGVFFATPRGSYSGVREMFAPVDADVFDSADVSEQVPAFLVGSAREMAESPLEGVLVVRTDEDRSNLYVYKFEDGGDQRRQQSAWVRWRMGGGALVHSVGWIESTLVLLVERAGKVHLETMTVSNGLADLGSSFVTRLDRRVPESKLVSRAYSLANDQTTITLPYDVQPGQSVEVVSRASGSTKAGVQHRVLSTDTSVPGANTVTVQGKHDADPLWVGQPFTQSVQLSEPVIRRPGEQGSLIPITVGRLQAVFLALHFSKTNVFTVRVKPTNGVESAAVFNAALVGEATVDAIALADSPPFSVPVLAKSDEVVVTIENPTPWPANLLGAEWQTNYVRESRRF